MVVQRFHEPCDARWHLPPKANHVQLVDAVEDAGVAVLSVVCKDDILARVNGEEPVPNGASVVDESVRHFLPRL